MSYSTPQMVRLALVPSLDGSLPGAPTNTAADLSDQQILDAIQEADAFIDAYVGRFYVVPIQPQVGFLDSPAGLITTIEPSAGALPIGQYWFYVTALNSNGETMAGQELGVGVNAAGSAIGFAFGAVAGATSYRVYGGSTQGGENVFWTTSTNTFTLTDYTTGTPGRAPNQNTAVTTAPVIPHPIDYWSRNIAAYNATQAFRESMDYSEQDPIARRYNATMKALDLVRAGTMQLQLPRNEGENAATGAMSPVNPYVGDLWDVADFDLRPANFDPTWGPRPYWYDAWWMR